MSIGTPSTVRAAIAKGTPAPVYLLLGDDEAEISNLAADITALVEDELRAFNVDRLYASDKSVTPATIVESARMLPMMSDRRVVLVMRAEKLLKPKRRAKGGDDQENGDEKSSDVDVLTEYLQRPEPSTILVFAASDVDRSRKLWKSGLQKHAVIVECWGLKPSPFEKVRTEDALRQAARTAEQMVRKAVADAGQQIEPAAARLLADRAGLDIVRLRGDVERLLLFTAGRPKITRADAEEVASPETAQDDWAVTSAIQQGNTAEALRQLGLAMDAGAVPYMVLGQLGYFVRERLADPRRIPAAVDALFRTDLDLKTSGGDPRVLLERLVVELCARPRSAS